MDIITMVGAYTIKKIISQSTFSELPEGSVPIGDHDGNGLIDYVSDSDGDGIIDTLINIF